MVACDVGLAASCASFMGSLGTLLVGVVYVVKRAGDRRLPSFDKCGFMEPDCNKDWRKVFTLQPEVLLDLWTPFVIGALGTCLHLKSPRLTFVRDYLQYGLFMLLTALVADVGYLGQCGMLVAVLSVVATGLCIFAHVAGERTLKVLDVGR
mmetsp:Transcript_105131/g.339066  ORF Transcript_105131/g.339066 Transcript_105131/m.339066 type:complete len:151 (-) Transcript_105131:16-468(-)